MEAEKFSRMHYVINNTNLAARLQSEEAVGVAKREPLAVDGAHRASPDVGTVIE